MNEILQKRIEEAAKKYNARAYSPFDDPYELSKEFERDCYCFKEGATFALENLWISVDEALPQKDDLYFVLINNTHPRVTEFENGKWQGYDNITHWMEIPKLNSNE